MRTSPTEGLLGPVWGLLGGGVARRRVLPGRVLRGREPAKRRCSTSHRTPGPPLRGGGGPWVGPVVAHVAYEVADHGDRNGQHVVPRHRSFCRLQGGSPGQCPFFSRCEVLPKQVALDPKAMFAKVRSGH